MDVKRRTVVIGGAMVAAVVVAATVAGGSALATGEEDQPLTGETYDRAVAAALAHTGGGTVTETETGDDGAAYEVEVKLADGSQVDVNLDENFAVTSSKVDDDSDEHEDEGDHESADAD